jgi:hypothetical protein
MFSFEANSHQFWTVFFTKLLPISAKFVFGMLIMMLHQKTQKEKTVQSCHSTIVVCKEVHMLLPLKYQSSIVTVCALQKGYLSEVKRWWQPCLGVEYACSQ